MNEIPLVRNNSINDINTSLIAIKKNIKQLDSVGSVSAPVANNNSGSSVSSIVTKLFVNAVYGRDTLTPLSISIDNQTYNVKVNKNGNLVDFLAREMTENGIAVFKYLQANTTLQFVIDGNTLIIIGNPLVISGNGYNYYADGSAINISYSTEEVATGGYWIDGKPIYRQIVPMYRNGSLLPGFTSVGGGRYTSTVTPRNMERIITNYANVLRQNNACDIITSSAGNSYGFSVFTTGVVYMNISVGSIKDIDIGLEYTKTTD